VSAPAPRANPHLLGHAATEAMLAEAIRSGRLHHAWLITGPEGIGKATLAFRFARRLLAGGDPGADLALPADHPTFKRVAAASHADLLTVEREWDDKRKRMRAGIVVETARRIPPFLQLTPAEGGWRVVVIDGAEHLNNSSANALLKVLEEPPPRAVLLLVCSAAGAILPTIRSRCRRLDLSALSETTVATLLRRYAPELPVADAERIVMLADGSIGRALDLVGRGAVGYAGLVDEVLANLDRLDTGRAHAVADALGKDEDAFATFMELLAAGIAAAVRDAARGHGDPDQARLLGDRPLSAWVDLWHALRRLQQETEDAYLDKRQAVVTGLRMLATSTAKAP
jgi:DNA polymerase III subunit delta'